MAERPGGRPDSDGGFAPQKRAGAGHQQSAGDNRFLGSPDRKARLPCGGVAGRARRGAVREHAGTCERGSADDRPSIIPLLSCRQGGLRAAEQPGPPANGGGGRTVYRHGGQLSDLSSDRRRFFLYGRQQCQPDAADEPFNPALGQSPYKAVWHPHGLPACHPAIGRGFWQRLRGRTAPAAHCRGHGRQPCGSVRTGLPEARHG